MRALLVLAPHRQLAGLADLLNQLAADQAVDHLLRSAPLQLLGQDDRAVLALRGGGQDDELRIAELGHDEAPGLARRDHRGAATSPSPAGRAGRG